MTVKTKKYLFLIATAVLLVLIICISIITITQGGNSNGAVSVVENDEGADTLKIVDINDNAEVLIPKYDYPVASYDMDKFLSSEGLIKYEDDNATFGIDVSEFNGTIDWEAVAANGIDFAMIRCAWRGYSEGGIHEDTNFRANITGAKNAGLDVGVYFNSQAISAAEAEEEADYVTDLLLSERIQYPVAFDWEHPNVPESENPRTLNMTSDGISECTKAFCDRIKRAGYTAVFYTNKWMGYNTFDLTLLKDYDMWYAEYMSKPSMYYNFTMWQYTESAKVPGVNGNTNSDGSVSGNAVDLNICFKKYS